jgi:hypothetical protein
MHILYNHKIMKSPYIHLYEERTFQKVCLLPGTAIQS